MSFKLNLFGYISFLNKTASKLNKIYTFCSHAMLVISVTSYFQLKCSAPKPHELLIVRCAPTKRRGRPMGAKLAVARSLPCLTQLEFPSAEIELRMRAQGLESS
jgi:hypothetical protein